MNCEHVQTLLYGYVCEALNPRTHKQVAAHLSSPCPGCAQQLAQVRIQLKKFPGLEGPLSSSLSAQTILRLAHRRARWMRYAASALILTIFFALLGIGLLIARYRHERILLEHLEKACVIYRLEYGVYPSGDLFPLLDAHPVARHYLKLLRGRLNAQGQLIDYWGTPLHYVQPGQRNPGLIDLYSCGRNGLDENGEGDDIKNWFAGS